MQTILNFLIKHNHWFLFTLLEGISFVLIISFNNYQSAVMFTSANNVAGNIYSVITDVDSYFIKMLSPYATKPTAKTAKTDQR